VATKRQVLELGDGADDAAVENYKQRIAAATQRGGQEGGVPLGHAKPLAGTPVLTDHAHRGAPPMMPEQEEAFTADELRDSIRTGGLGSGPAAASPPPDEGEEQPAQQADAAVEEQAEEGDKPRPDVDPKFFEMLMQQRTDQLDNPEVREAIEARCEPIDIRHYVVGRGGIQRVPIVEGKFEVTFRALSGQEDLFAKRYTWDVVKSTVGERPSQMYHDTVMGMVQVALSVTRINDEEILEHRKSNGEVDEETFEKKFFDLLTRPFVILQDIWLNHGWFDDRIRDAINVETLGNG